MRANIFSMVDASKRAQAARTKTPSPYLFIFHRRFVAIAAALLLVVFTGGGTAFAAQGALPGTPLYPVKIYVNENVQGALAISDEAKVSFHTSVAQTRLKEAETLASQGKLDATTSQQIENNLNNHIAQADTIAATLTEQDPAAGVEASVNLDSSLAAHGSILARLGNNSSDEATKENSDTIAQHMLARGMHGSEDWGGGAVVAVATSAPMPRVQTMSLKVSESAGSSTTSDTDATLAVHPRTMMGIKPAIAPATTSATSTQPSKMQQKLVLQLQKSAASELSDTHQAFSDAQAGLDASTTAKVTAQLADLAGQMDNGAAQIQSNQYDSARTTFTDVIRGSIELSTLIDASKTFQKDFVHSLGQDNSGNNSDNQNSGDQNSNVNTQGGGAHGGRGQN